jgi:hypothetical protein
LMYVTPAVPQLVTRLDVSATVAKCWNGLGSAPSTSGTGACQVAFLSTLRCFSGVVVHPVMKHGRWVPAAGSGCSEEVKLCSDMRPLHPFTGQPPPTTHRCAGPGRERCPTAAELGAVDE